MPTPTSGTTSPSDGDHPRWRAAGVAGWSLLLAALLLFLAIGDAPERTQFWDAVFDAGHAPLFGFIALAILALLRARGTPGGGTGTSWRAFALTVALGAVTEILQFLQPNRDPSVEDLLRDVAGSGAFLLIEAAARPRGAGAPTARGRTRRVAAVAVAALLLVAAFAQLATTVAAYAERRRALPVLFALDGSWWEGRFVQPHDSVLTIGAATPGLASFPGEHLVRLDLNPGPYPGLALDEPYPDWSGYRRLAFTVVSDLDAPESLTIRVHDAAHDQRYADRFNRSLVIRPGVNRVAIPIDDIRRAPDHREMDMHRIRGIILFRYQLAAATHLYVGAFRLE